MKIFFHHNFEKEFKKLSTNTKNRFNERLRIFERDPFNPILRNHALVGKYGGHRSISVGGDMRALYRIVDEDNYWFTNIGTHTQLYDH